MRALVVHSHPVGASYSSALRDAAVRGLRAAGHHVDVIDLAARGFDPVMTKQEWQSYVSMSGTVPHELADDAALVRDAGVIVFVYPTWWSGQPAVLKAWIDRVLANGVAWNLDETTGQVMPTLRNVTRIVVVTTHGRSKSANLLCGRAGRTVVVRSIRRLCSWRCRTHWLALYSVDRSTRFERDRFKQRVERILRRIS